jgi:NTF2 fold immunity protein
MIPTRKKWTWGMKILGGLLGFLVLIAAAMGQTYTPRSGYVPDAKTAIAIAEAVLIPVYGEKQIAAEQPLHATLKNNDGQLKEH